MLNLQESLEICQKTIISWVEHFNNFNRLLYVGDVNHEFGANVIHRFNEEKIYQDTI